MRTVGRIATLIGVLTVVGTATAAAQRPQTRQGFWIAFGLGYGSAALSCTDCQSDRESGGVGHVRLGGTLGPRVLLGGDVTAWSKDIEGVTATIGNVSAVVQFYPRPAGGFFLKGGAGFSSVTFAQGGQEISGSGFGLSAGAGYDVRVGRNVSLTPLFDFLFGGSRDLQFEGSTVIPGVSKNIFTFGLGVTFH